MTVQQKERGAHTTASAPPVVERREIGYGRAHAKVVLLGEHTVVHGTTALALPVRCLEIEAVAYHPDRGRVEPPRASRGSPRTFRCDSSDAGPVALQSGVPQSVRQMLRRHGIADSAVEVALAGAIPPARGLGSSAAATVAAVTAVAELYRIELDRGQLYETVQFGEHIAHGRASGVDTASVLASGPILFAHGASHRIGCRTDAAVVIADTGIRSSTRQAVSAATEYLDADPPRKHVLLSRAQELIDIGAHCLRSGGLERLGHTLTEFHQLLHTLGVAVPANDRLVDAAIRAGAYGAKLTGGGMGGCVIAVTDPDTDSLRRVRTAVTDAGAVRTWITPIGDAS
ncbi:mevalonate kinase [Nocardia brasiliensis]|uniref:mevalonate kinase n=1 Tax=Nocardia brasiliensis TaxID=37326 RepID=UPI00245713EB|nr:mevalonate kinase [Nocardia brasiliensis]